MSSQEIGPLFDEKEESKGVTNHCVGSLDLKKTNLTDKGTKAPAYCTFWSLDSAVCS